MKNRIFSMALAIILIVSMGIPALAAEAESVKVTSPNSDGYIVLSEVLQTKKETLKLDAGWSVIDMEVTVYYVAKGSKVTATFATKHQTGQRLFDYVLYKKSSDNTYKETRPSAEDINATYKDVDGRKTMTISNLSQSGVYYVSDTRIEGTSVWIKVVADSESDKAKDNAAAEKKFEIKKLQSAVKSMSDEQKDKKLFDTRITVVNNQLIYLNKEFAAGNKVSDKAAVKTALQDADKLLKKIDIDKLSVYAKANADKKTDKAALAETQKKLDKLRANLDKALKSIG